MTDRAIRPERLLKGLYVVKLPTGRVYYVEDVTRDVVGLKAGERQWNISEAKERDGVRFRDAPCDAAGSLRDAVALVAGWVGSEAG